MNFLILIIVSSFATKLIPVQSEELHCDYKNDEDFGYTCELSIFNPNGLNNFSKINGTHQAGKSDSDVRNIKSTQNSLTTNIPSAICDKYRNTIVLQFVNISITKIDEYSFRSCDKLEYLILDSNRIRQIHENSFVKNSKLQIMCLSDNMLSTLSPNTFAYQIELNMLELNRNGITDLPENIFKSLGKLKSLDLERNSIKELKVKWFENLDNLEVLQLNFNQIKELPLYVFSKLKYITKILLSNNNLEVIHSRSFGIHTELKSIHLQNDEIVAIDEKLIDNTGIMELKMTNNTCFNSDIIDNAPSRENMRMKLRKCFENYEAGKYKYWF